MREVGRRLDTFRRELMLAWQAGLTATYNLVHDERCADADIAELRDIHRAIDEVVVLAYGWDDLIELLDHGFHDTRQGPRFTTARSPVRRCWTASSNSTRSAMPPRSPRACTTNVAGSAPCRRRLKTEHCSDLSAPQAR